MKLLNHFNRYTGEQLQNSIQVCSGCHRNFSSTKAGDKHRIGAFGKDRRCASPEEVGLVKNINPYGAIVYSL
jgi:hypothetical protein